MKKWRICTGLRLLLMAVLLGAMLLPGAVRVQAKKKPVISQKKATMVKGERLQLTVKNAGSAKITWKSSKKKVAIVYPSGVVIARSAGKATITAKVKGKKLKCKIVVNKKKTTPVTPVTPEPSSTPAEKLRKYVLEKGENAADTGNYVLETSFTDPEDGDSVTLRLIASQDKNDMQFRYASKQDNGYTSVSMTIDLISGTGSTKNGSIRRSFIRTTDYEETEYPDESVSEAVITTAFDGKGAGIQVTGDWYYEHDQSTGAVVDNHPTDLSKPENLAAETQYMTAYAVRGFVYWNSWMKSINALKSAGVNMNTIGFGAWSE